MAFYELEPFGEERDDLRMGILASTVANIGTQGRQHFTPADFRPQFGRKRQSVSDMQAVLMAASHRGANAAAAKAKRDAARARAAKAKK